MIKQATAILLVLATPAVARAQGATFRAEGTVTYISSSAPFSVGDVATLEYTFDTAADGIDGSNGRTFYPVPDSYTMTLGTLSVTLDQATYPSAAGSTLVANDVSSGGVDCYDDYGWNAAGPGPIAWSAFELRSTSMNSQAQGPCADPPTYLLDNSLPTAAPDVGLASPGSLNWQAFFLDGDVEREVSCSITSLTMVSGGAANYCTATPNSVSQGGGRMGYSGSTSVLDLDQFVLEASPVPNSFFVFLVGSGTVSAPLFDGFRCVASPRRLNAPMPATGNLATRTANEAALLAAGQQAPMAGTQLFFQCLYRDAGMGTGVNLTDGLSIVFGP